MAHVFISYKHEDGDFAAALKKRIEEAGFETWWDADIRAGDEWRESIDQAIRDSFACVVIMTPVARASEFVTYEWACALGTGKAVIPVLLQRTPLHPRLEALQHFDFTVRQARPWNDLIERLREEKDEFIGLERARSEKVSTGQTGVPNTADLLKGIVSDDEIERSCAASALVELGSFVVPGLIVLLRKSLAKYSLDAAETIIEVIGMIGDFRAMQTLQEVAELYSLYGTASLAAQRAIRQIRERNSPI